MKTAAILHAHPLHVGGVETHLLMLIGHGANRGWQWLIVAPVSPTFAARAGAVGASVVPWSPQDRFDRRAVSDVARLVAAERVDLLHSHDRRAVFLSRSVVQRLDVPMVATVHLPLYDCVQGWGVVADVRRAFYRRAEAWLNRHFATRVIYVSPAAHDEAVSAGIVPAEKGVLIENGVMLERYETAVTREVTRGALSMPSESVVVCCVARFHPQKDLDTLLRAIQSVDRDNTQWEIWLVGDGAERAALEREARTHDLDGVVRFLGMRDDVPALLAAADIFVLPSRYEAFPMTILEAMAAGLPCVVTDVGSNRRIVKDGLTGWVVPPEDPAALADRLSVLIGNAKMRKQMGEAARRRVQSYSAERMVARTLEVYEEVLRERAGGV